MRQVARLVEDLPARLRWSWRVKEHRRRKVLCMVSPRGTVWEFRMNGGSFIRREEEKHG
jgi:hypothetical protein